MVLKAPFLLGVVGIVGCSTTSYHYEYVGQASSKFSHLAVADGNCRLLAQQVRFQTQRQVNEQNANAC
jgi:hypothetical protein